MRAGEEELRDLTTYAEGRWPTLVRTLVLVGAPLARAEAVAVEALARLGATWSERNRWPDLEVHTFVLLREAWAQDRSKWWETAGPEDPGPEESVLDGLGQLEPELDRLDVGTRWRLVLATVVGLQPEQLEDLLGPAPTGAPRSGLADAVATLASALRVSPLPSADVATTARRRRRGRAGATAALVGVVVLAVAGAASYVALRTQDAAPATARGPAASTPTVMSSVAVPTPVGDELAVPVAWWAGGAVRVGDVTSIVSTVVGLRAVSNGVVVEDATGRLTLLAPGVRLRPIGSVRPGAGFRASGDLVAFVDADRGPTQDELVVMDVPSRTLVLQRRLAPGARLVALDGDVVYYAERGRAYAASFGGGTSEVTGAGRLLDVRGGVRAVRRPDGRIEVLAGSREAPVVPGAAVELSRDGRYALVTPGAGSRTSSRPTPYVLDTTTGTSSPLPLPLPAARVVDAVFGPGDAITVAVLREQGDEANYADALPPARGSTYDLLTCARGATSCRLDVRVLGIRSAPVLAR